ncbi:hypothetical protein G7B40_024410 [Aetokthonos hydrillicola Thurmond2011]|uniref:Uncharacterized protein n=1 Tax=Aetokthonos hydrillicola Thurmond2011 TaxID=2712845 RepID=A0AAP5ICX4_9CYAN|nr:hypothetical protein [Aetokthonos hydrillicola]MBO3458381.1 hypothetical protein [Aetokthonos hydrillicola CCALA 1050]MBW4586079.1 hypothetical protein [Aetokthonos hydrillicola CCALA 1050]MDR9897687.1 hypothetical protein [Aetokthonos hydrillicola Thurmond2011]
MKPNPPLQQNHSLLSTTPTCPNISHLRSAIVLPHLAQMRIRKRSPTVWQLIL